ncbi:MAG: hypothetical protein GSR84_03725 [Desulfurococcales archaeon]|nr:hypothetical protein [Desulfurococcales archaeon]
MKRILPILILTLPIILAPISTGQANLILQDPEGDAVGFQLGQDAVASIDIVYTGIHEAEDGLIIIMKFAGEQLGEGTYGYRVSVQDQGSDKMYELVLVTAGGSVVNGEYIIQLPTGTIIIPVTQDDVSMEGTTITVNVRPQKAGIQEVPLPTTDKSLQEVQLIVEASYTAQGGIASDEANTFIYTTQQGRATTTQARAEPTTEPPDVPLNTFKDLEAKASGVQVEIKGTPQIRLVDTVINGIPYTILEINTQGTSQGADHVGLAIEIFINGKLDTQTIINMETHPDSMLDSDGAKNGYTRSIQIPLGPNAPTITIDETLKPTNEWKEWSFTGVYKMPAVQLAKTIEIQELFNQIKEHNVEVYITAIAFSDPTETKYTTITKKAEIKLTENSSRQENPQETTTKQDEQQEQDRAQEGAPITVLATIAIIILATAGIILTRIK